MLRYSVPFAALALACAPAQAATIVVNHELDPGLIGPAPIQDILPMTFQAGLGDTVEFNLSFTGGPVSLIGDTYLWATSFTSSGVNVRLVTTTSWTFISPSANLVAGPIVADETSEFSHVGAIRFLPDYRLDNAPITFSGIKASITITALEPAGFGQPIEDPRGYLSIALVTDGLVTAVPEPASWAMMIGGFALVGSALRRRTSRISFA